MTMALPRRSPLDAVHRALGARIVPYAGYEMPLRYGSELEEHRAVRTGVGLFDLSHMGEVAFRGRDALPFLRHALVSDPASLVPGQAQYSMLCTQDGGVIDDVIVYRTDDEAYLVVCNAANHDAVVGQFADLATGARRPTIVDQSEDTALLAPQGPAAAAVLAPLTRTDLSDIGYYHALPAEVAGVACLLARTGYTGEDGFELFCAAADAPRLWDALMESGAGQGMRACGLASRDTLRLEAGMPLYGNELSREVNPYEANLGRVVKLDKGEFVGRAALAAVAADGPRRRLVGLVMTDEGIARQGYPVVGGPVGVDTPIGHVTSGSLSPTLGTRIAMALVEADQAEIGRRVGVIIRGRRCEAEQVKLPFYRRPRPAA
jgi:aminomethyltransferase